MVIIVYHRLRNVNIIKIILIDLNAFQKLKDIRLTKKSKHKRSLKRNKSLKNARR